jgi:plasmid stability protein
MAENTPLVHVAFMITARLKSQLEEQAARNDRSQSAELRQILTREFDRQAAKGKQTN